MNIHMSWIEYDNGINSFAPDSNIIYGKRFREITNREYIIIMNIIS